MAEDDVVRSKTWGPGGSRLEEAKRKLEDSSGFSLKLPSGKPPLLDRRQSSRLKNRHAAAPYPPGRNSSSAALIDGSTGLTPMMRVGMNVDGFPPDAEALADEVLADLESMRASFCRHSSAGAGQSAAAGKREEEEESVMSEEAGEERRTQSMPTPGAREAIVRVNDLAWRSPSPRISRASNCSDASKSTAPGEQLMTGEVAGEEAEHMVESVAMARHMHEINENLFTLKEYLLGGNSESKASLSPSRDALRSKLHEIIETEHNYVQDLRFLVESFLTPLRAMISHEQTQSVFANAEQLLELHVGIDAELQAHLPSAPAELLQRISACFVQRIPFFKMYADFCSNYVYAASKLRLLRTTNEKVADFLNTMEAQYSTTLLALLIRPVQRACQYPLLFREVTAHLLGSGKKSSSAIDDASAAQFHSCAESMQQTIAELNEKVREQENTLRMRGILTAELHGSGLKELLSPTRSLVYEGPVRLRVENSLRPEWRAKRDYKVYVFSDLMFIARQNLTNSGFTVKVRMPLPELRCELTTDTSKASFIIQFGGVTYKGSTAERSDAELLVMRIHQAQAKLSQCDAGDMSDGSNKEGAGGNLFGRLVALGRRSQVE